MSYELMGLGSYELMGLGDIPTRNTTGWSGLGRYADFNGLGATTLLQDCGPAPRSGEPAGLSATYRKLYPSAGVDSGGGPLPKLCGPSYPSVLATLCNLSGNPAYCYVAKGTGKSFLGRGTAADVQAWIKWDPAATCPPGTTGTPPRCLSVGWGMSASPGPSPTPVPVPTVTPDVPPSDNTNLYLGLGVGAVLLALVAWKMSH